jgi:hypothetical protein|tara:strand:- start:164 stop:1612 length:1449 start_codon:yes stop_codon:yes gene_type:complete
MLNNMAAVKQFAGFINETFHKESQPYVRWADGRGSWQRCMKQEYPVSEKQMIEHLYGGEIVFGCEGLNSPSYTALDIDNPTEPNGVELTEDGRRRYEFAQDLLDGKGIPVRSSDSGGIHLYARHDRGISSALRDVCIKKMIFDRGADIKIERGVLELFPQPSTNFRWPFGVGSYLLNPELLSKGFETPTGLSKEDQIGRFVTQPCYQYPNIAESVLLLRDKRRRDQQRETGLYTATPSRRSGVDTPFTKEVARLLNEGPRPGKHNEALGKLALHYTIQGYELEQVKAAVWDWQCTKATGCNEWQQDGPDACRKHIKRQAEYAAREFILYDGRVKAIEVPTVAVADALTGLKLFGRDTSLLRAWFKFCEYVRPRFEDYAGGVMPLHSHHKWQTWSRRKYKELQWRLERADICVPVQTALYMVQSTRYRIKLRPTGGETFSTWSEAVWEACGRDRTALGQHFTDKQIREHFDWLDGPTTVVGTL